METRVSRLLKRCFRAGLLFSLLYGSYRYTLSAFAQSNHRAIASLSASHNANLHPGDLVFMEFKCGALPSSDEIVNCYKEQVYRRLVLAKGKEKRYRQGEWDAVAVVVKDESDTRVIGFLNGVYCSYPANTFAELPFLAKAAVRRLNTIEPHMDRRSANFFEAAEILQQALAEGWSLRKPEVFRDSVDLVLNFLVHVNLADTGVLKNMLKLTVEDLNVPRPKFIGVGAGQYSDLIPLKPFTPF